MGSQESSWESETGASSVVLGNEEWVSDEGGRLFSGELWWSLRSGFWRGVVGDDMVCVIGGVLRRVGGFFHLAYGVLLVHCSFFKLCLEVKGS